MARWKTLRYALPSFLLLGRTAGIPEQELQDQWQKGDRETAIEKATASPQSRAPVNATRTTPMSRVLQ